MSGAFKKIGSGIGKFFGGSQGEYYTPTEAPKLERAAQDSLINRGKVNSNSNVLSSLDAYSQGNQSLQDVLGSFGTMEGEQRDAAREKLATDPLSGSKLATNQVQDNDILGQLYGKGGALERANTEEQELASRGYSLTPEDYEAYGQMSDELARQFAGQEKSLGRALARQGLSAAPSGVAAKQFSGLAGNKFEQLAGLQRQVANDRMNMNMQRLNNTRNYMTSLGGQANDAINDQYGRNLSGIARADDNRNALVANEQNRNNMALDQWRLQNGMNQASMQDKREAYDEGAFGAFGKGLKSSFASLGAAPGKFVSSVAGGAAAKVNPASAFGKAGALGQ